MSRRTVIGLAVAAAALVTVAGAGVAYATVTVRPAAKPAQAKPDQLTNAADVNRAAETPVRPEVPPPAKVAAKPMGGAAKPAASSSCGPSGPAQLVVERFIAARPYYGKVTVDGRQSAQDCKAIAKLQQRFRIMPAKGYAGKVTGNVVRRLTAANLKACDARGKLTVCVDLTSQTMWVTNGKRITFGPTPIRTGRAGLATPPGHFSISEKKKTTVSSYFKVKLPYWQRFYRDMGFHQTTTYLYEGDHPGSHGCANVLRGDAAQLYALTKRGTHVHIFGKKPR